MIVDIFRSYTDQVEPLSLDEAYLDVTKNKRGNSSATLLAREIKQHIYEQTGLTASAGVSYNKFLAKAASDYQKPNGLTVVTPEQAFQFIDELPIGKFFGVGKKTEALLMKRGIRNGADLENAPCQSWFSFCINGERSCISMFVGLTHAPSGPIASGSHWGRRQPWHMTCMKWRRCSPYCGNVSSM